MLLIWLLVRSTIGRYRAPTRTQHSGSRGKRTSSGMSERRRLGRCERYGACEDAASLRSRPLGGWARGLQFYWRPLRLKPAPAAARPAWGVSSETTAPLTTALRQQGGAESLLVFVVALVDASIITHRTRAARDGLPTLSTSPANPTPVLRGIGTVSVP